MHYNDALEKTFHFIFLENNSTGGRVAAVSSKALCGTIERSLLNSVDVSLKIVTKPVRPVFRQAINNDLFPSDHSLLSVQRHSTSSTETHLFSAITRRLAETLWVLKESSETDKKNLGEENEQFPQSLQSESCKRNRLVEKRDLYDSIMKNAAEKVCEFSFNHTKTCRGVTCLQLFSEHSRKSCKATLTQPFLKISKTFSIFRKRVRLYFMLKQKLLSLLKECFPALTL